MSGRGEIDERTEVVQLLANIKAVLPDLEALYRASSDHWGYEDPLYRFYHQSWKVYGLQQQTLAIVERLAALLPGRLLNAWFMQIITHGTSRAFDPEDNARWLEVTRPILEAFFHARYMLDMVCRYGRALESPPTLMPSGWAAVLYLYDLR